MTKILYYGIIKPISLLPLGVLYLLSDSLAFLMKYIVPYRKEVIMQNLRNSFPEKSEQELNIIKNKFLDYFSDLMAESLRLFSMPQKEVEQRLICLNPEILKPYLDRGTHIIVATGHYGNWELAASGISQATNYIFNGVFSPLKNEFINKKITDSRTAFGTMITNKHIFKTWVKDIQNMWPPQALTFIGDQSATYSKNVYWMNFLNQETAVMFGAEKYAKELNLPFFIARIHMPKRGYYEVTMEHVTDHPQETPHGFITAAHTKALESWIIERPELWLWTHRRWKRKRKPEEVLAN